MNTTNISLNGTSTTVLVRTVGHRPSTCADIAGALDLDVEVRFETPDGVPTSYMAGEITLAPAQYDGRLCAYGDSPSCWVSARLLADLYAACEGAPADTLRRVLDLLEATGAETVAA